MKIISDYKDFYDRIAWNFGGGDPKIPYVRKIKDIFGIKSKSGFNFFYDDGYAKWEGYRNVDIRDVDLIFKNEFRWLFFCGKRYLIVDTYKCTNSLYHIDFELKPFQTKILSEKYHTPIVNFIYERSNTWKSSWFDTSKFKIEIKHLIGYHDETHDILSKEVSEKLGYPCPIFIMTKELNSNDVFDINTNVNLSDLGFPALKSANQTYQEIESYIVNVLKDNPDLIPPAKVEDEHRIIQHGFDMKQSFRHRK